MSAVGSLLAELDGHVQELRAKWGHKVTWQKFERAAGVVQELEAEMAALGLPVEPVEAVTSALVGVASALHTALDPATVPEPAPVPEPAAPVDQVPPAAPVDVTKAA